MGNAKIFVSANNGYVGNTRQCWPSGFGTIVVFLQEEEFKGGAMGLGKGVEHWG